MVKEDGGDQEQCGRITSRNGQKYHIMTVSEWHKIENDGDPWQPTCWLQMAHNDDEWWYIKYKCKYMYMLNCYSAVFLKVCCLSVQVFLALCSCSIPFGTFRSCSVNRVTQALSYCIVSHVVDWGYERRLRLMNNRLTSMLNDLPYGFTRIIDVEKMRYNIAMSRKAGKLHPQFIESGIPSLALVPSTTVTSVCKIVGPVLFKFWSPIRLLTQCEGNIDTTLALGNSSSPASPGPGSVFLDLPVSLFIRNLYFYLFLGVTMHFNRCTNGKMGYTSSLCDAHFDCCFKTSQFTQSG